jgi:endonuclease/exonuclease/phosphatase family metal-dependent hydrolase
MRMATFNILHAHAVGEGVDIDRFRRVIGELDVDLLALQEVDCDQPRSGMADLTAVAAEAMAAVSHRFVAAISGTPGATWMSATGSESPGTAAYGVALLSRFPATTWQVVRLPQVATRFPMYLPGPKRVMIVHEEPRSAVIGRFETPLGVMTVANTHLSFVPGWNRRQLLHLVRDLRGLPGPRVLTGDLNMSPPAVRRWSRLRSLAVGLTFPADAPDRQLDHVLTDDAELIGVRTCTPTMPISDHRPLVVELDRTDA